MIISCFALDIKAVSGWKRKQKKNVEIKNEEKVKFKHKEFSKLLINKFFVIVRLSHKGTKKKEKNQHDMIKSYINHLFSPLSLTTRKNIKHKTETESLIYLRIKRLFVFLPVNRNILYMHSKYKEVQLFTASKRFKMMNGVNERSEW